MRLVKPTMKYGRGFSKAIAKSRKMGERSIVTHAWIGKNFKDYIATLRNHEKGKNLPKDWVSYTSYWLVDENKFLGEVQIRHRLTKHLRQTGGLIGYAISPYERRKGYGRKILELGLKKAKGMGLKKISVTCDATNIGSKKIIEANGGIFEKSRPMGRGKPRKLLYWIKN